MESVLTKRTDVPQPLYHSPPGTASDHLFLLPQVPHADFPTSAAVAVPAPGVVSASFVLNALSFL